MTEKKQKIERNKIDDKSGDRGYFVITPRLVWALSRHPYDYTLWGVVKDVAGDNGQCYLDTSQLAILAMMSDGQVSDSREYLLAVGLLAGKKYREHDYPLPVWHLQIPDLWRPNLEWCQQFKSVLERLDFKVQQKAAVKKIWDRYKKTKATRKAAGEWEYDREILNQVCEAVGFSPGEKGFSYSEKGNSPGEKTSQPGEKPSTPGERKKIHKENHPYNNMDGWMVDDPICVFLQMLPGYNSAFLKSDRETIGKHSYTTEGLTYLWEDAEAEASTNPVGLFLNRAGQGLQSPRYLDLLAERKREASIAEQRTKTLEQIQPREEMTSVRLEADASVTDRHAQIWNQIASEMSLEIHPHTFRTQVQPARLISVNGSWKIAVPSIEFWNKPIQAVIKTIYHGITGENTTFEFMEMTK